MKEALAAPKSPDRDDREQSLSALATDPHAALHPGQVWADGPGARRHPRNATRDDARARVDGGRDDAAALPRRGAELTGACSKLVARTCR